MSKLKLPEMKIGMVVITPCVNAPNLSEDKGYTILDIDGDWIRIMDDTGESRYYQSHLFIEADVYYSLLMWLTTCRILDIEHNDL
jgi:hypothetical protein